MGIIEHTIWTLKGEALADALTTSFSYTNLSDVAIGKGELPERATRLSMLLDLTGITGATVVEVVLGGDSAVPGDDLVLIGTQIAIDPSVTAGEGHCQLMLDGPMLLKRSADAPIVLGVRTLAGTATLKNAYIGAVS